MASLSDRLKKAKETFGGKAPALVTDKKRAKMLGDGMARNAADAIIARKKQTDDLLKELD